MNGRDWSAGPALSLQDRGTWRAPGDFTQPEPVVEASPPAHDDPAHFDDDTVTALRGGCETTFARLLGEHTATMLRVAALYVRNRAAAEDAVQETWLAVIRGIDHFDGRSSLKTWIFRILTNRAKTAARRDSRSVPISALVRAETIAGETQSAAEWFLDSCHPQWPHHWTSRPSAWHDGLDDVVVTAETVETVRQAIEALPSLQRSVVGLRDDEGWTSREVCDILGLSDGNQRVLLHRGRAKVRSTLAQQRRVVST